MVALGFAPSLLKGPRNHPTSSIIQHRNGSIFGGCKAITTRQLPHNLHSLQRTRAAAPQQEELDTNFGGALCTLVLGSVLLSERLNGEGLVHALELHNDAMHPILMFAVAALTLAGLWPDMRPPVQGIKGVQRAASRVSYLGLAGTIVAEMMTGKGALALLDIETGVEAVSDVEGIVAFMTMLILSSPRAQK